MTVRLKDFLEISQEESTDYTPVSINEIEDDQSSIDQIDESIHSLESLITSLESIKETGFTNNAFVLYQGFYKDICKRNGLVSSLESYSTENSPSVSLALEEANKQQQGFFKKALDIIINLLKKVWNWVKGFFSLNQHLINKVNKLKKILNDNKDTITYSGSLTEDQKKKYGKLFYIDGKVADPVSVPMVTEKMIKEFDNLKLNDGILRFVKGIKERSMKAQDSEYLKVEVRNSLTNLFTSDPKIKDVWNKPLAKFVSVGPMMPGNYKYAISMTPDENGTIWLDKKIVRFDIPDTAMIDDDMLVKNKAEMDTLLNGVLKSCEAQKSLLDKYNKTNKELNSICAELHGAYALLGGSFGSARVLDSWYYFKYFMSLFNDIVTKIPRVMMKTQKACLDIAFISITPREKAKDEISNLREAVADDYRSVINTPLALPSPA